MNPYPHSFAPNHLQDEATWSFEDNKLFEVALAQSDIKSPNLFQSIATYLPGKTIKQIKDHYFNLVGDIEMIESGSVPLPDYADAENSEMPVAAAEEGQSCHNKRKKGVSWTVEEHQLFLMGLEKYGKGDWKSISKFIRSRTPSQVASHAQKYFIRLKKSSILPTKSLASN